MIGKLTKKELVMERDSLYADLYQTCGSCTLHYLEQICRKISLLSMKIQSFKGGIQYDKD